MSNHKNLDEVVIEALKLHTGYKLPSLNFGKSGRKLIIASGNALPTGKIIFDNQDAVFADEGQYSKFIKKDFFIKKAIVISASGEKHSPIVIKNLLKNKINTYLLTCNENSSAAKLLPKNHVFKTASNQEPITYNTSTYLGMILSKTKENPEMILKYIKKHIDPQIPSNLGKYKAFYFIVPPEFDIVREMFTTKFDELFCPIITGRCFTSEQSRHAKTVIHSDKEMFISLGFKNKLFGCPQGRLNIPLPKKANYAIVIAIGYYLIGKIQEANSPYFHRNAKAFQKRQKQLFDNKFFKQYLKKYEI